MKNSIIKLLNKKMFFNKNLGSSQRYTGFTLAEVLITLGIIGVVAAITVPNLVANYQKEQTVTQLKKIYSEITQVVNLSIADNDLPRTWDWGSEDSNANVTRFVETYLLPYFKVAKNCHYANIYNNDCAVGSFYYLDGKTKSQYANAYHVILMDGTHLFMAMTNSETSLELYVDLNGSKKPNIMGKDVFFMWIRNTSDRVTFFNNSADRATILSDSSWGCNKTATWMPGLYCGALIQKDGWKISDDYPW